jgi:hypothetical protein
MRASSAATVSGFSASLVDAVAISRSRSAGLPAARLSKSNRVFARRLTTIETMADAAISPMIPKRGP